MVKRPPDGEKAKDEYLHTTTIKGPDTVTISIEPNGDISFSEEIEKVYFERSYERSKGRKVVTRVPQSVVGASLSPEKKLFQRYNKIFSIDTNRDSDTADGVYSVAIIRLDSVWCGSARGLIHHWKISVVCCLIYAEIHFKPENFGWIVSLLHLQETDQISDSDRVGLVVDSDLGNIDAFNKREKPVERGFFLPGNVELIYASSDTGRTNILNKLIATADSISSQSLRGIRNKGIKLNLSHRPEHFTLPIAIVVPGE